MKDSYQIYRIEECRLSSIIGITVMSLKDYINACLLILLGDHKGYALAHILIVHGRIPVQHKRGFYQMDLNSRVIARAEVL